MEKNNTCTPCEQNFRDEVDHLVDEVKGYTKKDHEQKKKEVDEAFGKGKEQESGQSDNRKIAPAEAIAGRGDFCFRGPVGQSLVVHCIME